MQLRRIPFPILHHDVLPLYKVFKICCLANTSHTDRGPEVA